jgi:hypothetical protein
VKRLGFRALRMTTHVYLSLYLTKRALQNRHER